MSRRQCGHSKIHGLAPIGKALQATKVYDGGGTLRVDFYTDADASDNLAQPNVRDDFQHEITLDGILPLPADRDYSILQPF